jgi:general secretion pathway protein K
MPKTFFVIRLDVIETSLRAPMGLHASAIPVHRQSVGFALVIVLWTLALISFVCAQIVASGRTEIRIASNLVANGVASAAADGAIYEAIFSLGDPRPKQRWPVDGMAREITIGRSRVTLRLENEAWWINPNLASPALLEALLRVACCAPESSRSLAGSISEWVGSAPMPRPRNVLLAEYRAARLDYGPPAAALESVSELGRVRGMMPDILAAIRPHLTLYGPPWPSPGTPDPIVAAALATAPHAGPALAADQPPPDVLSVRITATALGPDNARVTRSASVRFGAMLPGGYEILSWSREW